MTLPRLQIGFRTLHLLLHNFIGIGRSDIHLTCCVCFEIVCSHAVTKTIKPSDVTVSISMRPVSVIRIFLPVEMSDWQMYWAAAFVGLISICVIVYKLRRPSKKGVEERKCASVNYHFTRQCNYQCGFCFHTAKTSYVLPLEEAKRGLKLLKEAGKLLKYSFYSHEH